MLSKEIEEMMFSGEIYCPEDPSIMVEQEKCIQKVNDYNATPTPKSFEENEVREKMLKEMFGKFGERCWIEPPFHANFGGSHVYVGDHFYANFNLTLVDDGQIFIGDNVMMGPNVTVITALHPISPKLREKGYQYNKPVHIGNNVWIGANVTIFPGVHIGDNSIIGAGSLVIKDVPANVVAHGSPCKVSRPIEEE